jgi:DNA-binding NarL/FixJ family response regulator
VTTSVVLIDDDPAFRELARRMLTLTGMVVVGEADTVATGLETTVEQHPQAVLVDVGLPDGSGVDLATRLSGLPWRPRVVLTSADPDAATPAMVRLSGASGFAPKQELAGAGLSLLAAPV